MSDTNIPRMSAIQTHDYAAEQSIHASAILERIIRLEQAVHHLQHQQAEQQAQSAVVHVAGELKAAGEALLKAAQALKTAGATSQASDIHRAAQRALRAAEELRG